MRNPDFHIFTNLGADFVQCLCFGYKDSTIPLFRKSEILRIKQSSMVVQIGLCRTCMEIRRIVFSWCASCYMMHVQQNRKKNN